MNGIKLTPLKVIRLKCLNCQGGRPSWVRKCDDSDCPAFIYRFGKNPHRKGIGNLKGSFTKKPSAESAILKGTVDN